MLQLKASPVFGRRSRLHYVASDYRFLPSRSSGGRVILLLLLFAASSGTGSPHRFLLALWARRNRAGGIGCRCGCTLRAHPQLNLEFRHAAAIDYGDPAGVNTAGVHEVVLGAISSSQALAFTRAVDNDVALRRRFVLQ